MEVISGNSIERMCDYSFGDQAGVLMSIPGATMVGANKSNKEFLDFCKGKEHLNLFIDNIRLYNRPILANKIDEDWINFITKNNDLLALCATLPNTFTIYTSHEDTPIDHFIRGRIPPNVLKIYATNAIYNDDKVIPFPYGLQRKMNTEDNRHEIMKEMVEKDEHQEPTKLLYINCGLGNERNAPERANLPLFASRTWATCRFDKNTMHFPYSQYRAFLSEMRDHKFMICPQGHGIDCHRNWELLYMRRVPVMKQSPYFARLMSGFPVLFVNRWEDITEELLARNDHLYQEALTMDLTRLDLNKYEAR